METQVLIQSLVVGLLGGLLRSLVGLSKSKWVIKRQINSGYFWLTVAIAAIVGMAAGILAAPDYKFAFLAGYAGTDFLEGLYRLRLGKEF